MPHRLKTLRALIHLRHTSRRRLLVQVKVSRLVVIQSLVCSALSAPCVVVSSSELYFTSLLLDCNVLLAEFDLSDTTPWDRAVEFGEGPFKCGSDVPGEKPRPTAGSRRTPRHWEPLCNLIQRTRSSAQVFYAAVREAARSRLEGGAQAQRAGLRHHLRSAQRLVRKLLGVLYVNRPMIAILEQNGIRAKVFLTLRNHILDSFIDSMHDPHEAAKVLCTYSAMRLPYKELACVGVDLTVEPFFRALVRAVNRKALKELKTKARILVLPAFGRTMFGVLDETGTLEYGQVSVQYSNDMLRYKVNDTATILEGSDLDGDVYSVLWYADLIFKTNCSPMHYYSDPPPNAHLVLVDLLDAGINSCHCRDLARKCLVNLDFAKCSDLKELQNSEKPPLYPDFMEKQGAKNTYCSRKVLGQLYKNCGKGQSAATPEGQLPDNLWYAGVSAQQEVVAKSLLRYNVIEQFTGRLNQEAASTGTLADMSRTAKQHDLEILYVAHMVEKILLRKFSLESLFVLGVYCMPWARAEDFRLFFCKST
ncbi:hypothetical protein MRX96_016672 [Rhipicephalus microplus]